MTRSTAAALPTFAMSLGDAAELFTRTPPRIVAAMRAQPELVGGSRAAADTELMRRCDGWIAKRGAEGLFCAAHAGRRRLALKAPTARTRAIRPALGPCSGIDELPRRFPCATVARRGRRLDLRMKVFIVSDMEGVAGIVKWQQVTGGHAMYEEGRRLYTGEINAAVRGAKAAGATEIVVMDCHGAGEGWTFNSLIPEELDPDCEYVVQNEWTEYVEYLEEGSTPRSSSGCTRWPGRATACSPTRSAGRRGGASVQRRRGRRDRDQRGAVRHLGLPGRARHRRRGVVPRGEGLLGDGLTTVAVKKGLGRFSARQFPAAAGA